MLVYMKILRTYETNYPLRELYLTNFKPIVHFYTPWRSFLKFSGGTEKQNQAVMGSVMLLLDTNKLFLHLSFVSTG